MVWPPALWFAVMVPLGLCFGWLIFGDPMVGMVAGALVGAALYFKTREERQGRA